MGSAELRRRMVTDQLAGRGILDERVLDAMAAIPRERFVPGAPLEAAYGDHPLPIGRGQTISQPYIVALMAEAALVEPTDRVLEVGTGSGYGAAVLARLAAEVWTIERHATLARGARRALEDLGVTNVHVLHSDGTLGWPETAPFDAVVVTAASDDVPAALLDQLADGGRLVMPVGGAEHQDLVRIRRRGGELTSESLGAVRFVPLLPDVADVTPAEDSPG